MAKIVPASRWHFMRATNTPVADRIVPHRPWQPVVVVAQKTTPARRPEPTLFQGLKIKGCTSRRRPKNVFERLVAAANGGKLPTDIARMRFRIDV